MVVDWEFQKASGYVSKDIDIEQALLIVRDGKGHKDRQTILSHKCAIKLAAYINKAMEIQHRDKPTRIGPSLPTLSQVS